MWPLWFILLFQAFLIFSGCGGVAAAETNKQFGLIDNWLRNIKDVYNLNRPSLESIPAGRERTNLLVELNVARSLANVCHTTIVQNAWAQGQELNVHGWAYSIEDGIVRDLGLNISEPRQIDDIFVTEDSLARSVTLTSPARIRGLSSSQSLTASSDQQ